MAEPPEPSDNQTSKLLANGGNQDTPPGFDSIFSVRNPKDAVAGLSSGLKSIGKGVVGGVASLIALPIHGAQTEGPVGFAKGLGLGVLSAVAMTIGGIGTGVIQIGRGIANTPSAIKSKMSHQIWDEDLRVWYSYSLPLEKEQMEEEEKKLKETKVQEPVHSTELYDVIGVKPDANQVDIKKAYRTAAIKQHPDKNLDDPLAKEKFQKLGEAYQILSNPQLRAAYDTKGKEGIDKNALLDSTQLYEMIFGSARFEGYVGELQLLSLQESLKATGETKEEQQFASMQRAQLVMKMKQKKRELNCALRLAKTLDEYLQDQSEDHVNFITFINGEAKELASTPFGGTLIGVLGYVYEEQALHFLGFKKSVSAGLGINNLSQSAHIFASKYRVLTSAVKMYKIAKDEEKKRKDLGVAETDAAQPDQKSISGLMETLWNYTVVDIEHTLRSVCIKVLKDSSISLEDRMKRGDGLLMLGQVFLKFGQTADVGLLELGKTMTRGASPGPESPGE